ncbi:eukaryotic translation initiation factor 5 [Coemansia aciculifera]|uniref:Eukaryotic translation initiation factor 5 n=2 Tax=Coemansia TaxID=4863 RepID=A0A9W8LBR4_9FUNG|nr:eukaryotic translation initiation factor 5 [Coemansia pectinata]KAJ2863114.1 eukaryotic translation initiation factor 5 [Coemansia aciculifera]KAJ2872518.1 eukaryotic translation initiation factor 5 [Coemansia aciculifera]
MSSGNYNIPRSVKDSFHRYTMPRLQAKIEGKGNGIKTVLPNIVDVARALSRPPSYPTKYFGGELGAQVQIEEKSEKYIVNGAHEVSKLQDALDGFIDRYVLCAVCKNPETDLIVGKDKLIVRKCGACGERSNVDMRHGLAKYIVNHPPPKVKKGGQHASAGNGNASGSEADQGDDYDALAQETAKLALADEDDEDWDLELDMSDEAVAQRQVATAAGLSVIDRHNSGADNENEDSDDPYDQLGDFIRATPEATDREIFTKATELHLGKKHRAVIVVILCLFEESTTVVKDIAKHDKLLMSFGTSDKHQRAVIGGFERLIEERQDALLAKTPAILKALFDEEIVEEEAFLEWGKKPSKKYVDKDVAKKIHKAAEPFIQWLAEAEEATDSEDDEE